MIHRMVETAVRGKVEPMGVDLVPFALIRAVGQDEGLGLDESDAGEGFFLFTMLGGEEPLEQAAPTPSSSPPPLPGALGTGVGEPQEPPSAITLFGGRDPFVPLVMAASETRATAPTDAKKPASSEVTPDGGPVEEPAAGAETQEQPGDTAGGHQVTLVESFSLCQGEAPR
jgi:hypothetical protein